MKAVFKQSVETAPEPESNGFQMEKMNEKFID